MTYEKAEVKLILFDFWAGRNGCLPIFVREYDDVL